MRANRTDRVRAYDASVLLHHRRAAERQATLQRQALRAAKLARVRIQASR